MQDARPGASRSPLLLPERWVLPCVAALFATVFGMRMGVDPDSGSNALSMLYIVPVTLLAAHRGVRGGLVGASVAAVLTAAWLLLSDVHVGVVGVVVRLLAFYVTSVAVGVFADRVDALLLAERTAREALADTNRELARAVEQARLRNDELETANADLKQFGYVVSHDLAEPLRTMSGFAGLLESELGDGLGERGAQYLALIRGGAERMQALIDDLRAYTRAGQQELTTAEVDLGGLLDEVTAGLGARIAERNATVEHGPLPTVRGDRSMLGLVLQNLVSNGIKFNVSTRPRVCVEARDVEDAVEVDVVDNGIGVPAEQRDRIFGLFSRLHTREEYAGTGLGLAISRRVVERHGGHLVVVPAEGGTCMRLTLPGSAVVRRLAS
jgi:signal transduction histidine kinase